VGRTTVTGDASGAMIGGALAGAGCVGPVGILDQLKLGLSAGVGIGTEAAVEETGRTGADDQVNSDGLTAGVEVSTSGADEDVGIDPSADVGVGAGEGAA